MISDPEPRRAPATGYGLRADELGQQMMMRGITAAASAVIIVLLILAGFVIAGVLSTSRKTTDHCGPSCRRYRCDSLPGCCSAPTF